MNQNGICQFCGKNAKLVRRSHVISDFLHDNLKDGSDRMAVMSFSDPNKLKYLQTGFYDKYLYCQNCENQLWSKLEKYAAALFSGHPIYPEPDYTYGMANDKILPSLILENVNYKKLKLFYLVNLWRAHNSRNKFFNQIDLEEHADTIKEMILNNDAGPEEKFAVILIALRSVKGKLINIILEPMMKKGNGLWLTVFFVSGYIIIIDLMTNSNFELTRKASIKNSGRLEIPILNGIQSYEFMQIIGIPENVSYGYALN